VAAASRWLFHDITELKRNEAALLRERDFSVSALDSLTRHLYVLTPRGAFALERGAGDGGRVLAEEIGRMHPLEFFEEQTRPSSQNGSFRSSAKGRPLREAVMVVQGREAHALLLPRAKIISTGRIVSSARAGQSRRERSEKALRESEARLQKILEQSPISMAIVGADGPSSSSTKKFVRPSATPMRTSRT